MTWQPDAHQSPYVWLAALGGHTIIGLALWLACLWLGPGNAVFGASVLYVAWEAYQADKWGLLWWDSVLDTVGVTFGAGIGAYLWSQNWAGAAWCIVSCAVIGAAGYGKRRQ